MTCSRCVLLPSTTDDDKKRRMRALLSCLNADSACIRNPLYVPQHLLVLACVLR